MGQKSGLIDKSISAGKNKNAHNKEADDVHQNCTLTVSAIHPQQLPKRCRQRLQKSRALTSASTHSLVTAWGGRTTFLLKSP